VRARRALVGALVALLLVVGGTACSSSKDDSGAVTNLDDVGPQIAKLRLEVAALHDEVRVLRERLAVLDPSVTTTTMPGTPLR
jgi:hypothetical protein